MKIEWNKRYTTIAGYAFLVILLAVGLIFLFLRFDAIGRFVSLAFSACKPLIYAVAVAYILWPLLRVFENKVFARSEKMRQKKKLTRVLSLIITYILFLAVLSLFFGTVIPQISDSIVTLKDKIMGGYLTTTQEWIEEKFTKNPIFNSDFFKQQFERLNDFISDFISWIYDNMSDILGSVTSFAANFALEIKNILLGIVFAIYFLLFKENLLAQIKKLFTSILPKTAFDRTVHYAETTNRIFGGFINGKLLDSLIIGLICFIGMTVFRMPYAPLISMIVGITNVIPFFGPFIGAIPSAFIILIAKPSLTLWFLLFILLLQQLDGNVIGPKILGDFVGLNSLWIIISITVMGGIFGIFGMFLGVPTFAVIYVIIKELTEKKLTEKGLPTETSEYYADTSYLAITAPAEKEPKKLPFSALKKKFKKKH